MSATIDIKAAQMFLARRAAEYRRSGRRLSQGDLLRLYRCRHQVEPKREEAVVLMASMRWEKRPGLRLRQRELGWFWFRKWQRKPLRDLLDEVDAGRRATTETSKAVESAPFRCPEDPSALRQLLRSTPAKGSGHLRADAVRKLAAYHKREDLPLIRRLAKEGHLSVRWAVAQALGRFRCPEDVPLLKTLARGLSAGPALESLLGYRGSAASAAIHALSRDKDDCMRGNLAVLLRQWRQRDAAVLLRRLAQDKYPWPRSAAASSLGVLRLAKDLPLLRRMTGDKDASVRREAVWSVGLYRQAEDIALLQACTGDEAWEVRMVAAMALSRVMTRRALERWLDENIHQLSIEVLRELDFALYAPAWVKKSEPRTGDNDIRLELGMCQPDYAE